ncbi:diaminopimelate decarboxylase [Pedobacter heparinus]|uniref:Diaminopimelate decarboxylase n=1 Tax=Pedobacter heparinus (strain ATCC 13125 / DSM 2366 / CIP 104194 / JCM 7457 / NBRC 12017 / NCIMB 9290 / NRRL B-14731 / HIM 762-3) TaxID=485917 RepID=C6XYQ4_PEDHD|nr:diaminopimelate decarboxylase [Pedobacter heparinus]ACU04536.1 diaminopimelate decarboxylase [Pedobacter heparinus DSM 2366]
MFSNKDISRFANLETPFYYYDLNLLQNTLNACANAAKLYNFHVHYALKANFNPAVLKKVKAIGFGADCVSGGEVNRAIETGFNPKQVVFAGVGKSDKEINLALDQDIFCFNVESVQELEVINELAGKKGKIAKIAIRINPNVDAHTHHNITTGLDENKFGVNSWDLPKCVETLKVSEHLEFLGIHFHIGSQITNLDVYKNLCVRVNEFAIWFEERGFNVKILNVGGGLGIDYHNPEQQIPDFDAYFKIFSEFLEVKAGQEVHFELGRALVGQCASLISRVLYIKNGKKKNFVVLDAGMTELMRPALYQAYHKIENLSRGNQTTLKYDIVGPICESTDCFGKEVEQPESFRGDLYAIRSAGAYGEVMASKYNLRDEIRSVYSEEA